MRASRILISALYGVFATSTASGQSAAVQPPIPLSVVQVQDVPHNPDTGEPRHIAVTLRNTGTKLIVAWGVRSEARLANSTILPSFVTADAYENVGRTPTDPSLLAPNELSTVSMNSVNEDVIVVDIVAAPAFAVFDDDTAVGLSAEIDKKFANRAASINVYRALDQLLSDTSRSITDSVQAARAARASLEAMTDRSLTRHWSHRYIVQQLTSIIDSTRPINKTDAMARLIDEVRSRRVAAETHSQRRY
jgi:hypothetical protein